MIVCQSLLKFLLPLARIAICWQLPGICTRNVIVAIQHTTGRRLRARSPVSLTEAEITPEHACKGAEELATQQMATAKYPPLATTRTHRDTAILRHPAHKVRRQGSSLTCSHGPARQFGLGERTGVSPGRAVDRAPADPPDPRGTTLVAGRHSYSRHGFGQLPSIHRNPGAARLDRIGGLALGEAVTPSRHYLRVIAARVRHAVCCRRHWTGVHLGVANISVSERSLGGSSK